MNLPENSKQPKVCWEWEEWLESRNARRRISEKIGPSVSRRSTSSADKKLRRLFKGERGPSFH